MQKATSLTNITKEKYFFEFYNGKLTIIKKDIIAANIIVVLSKNGNHNNITVFERNTKNVKTKFCDIFEDEILKIKSEIGTYICPKNIKTISALKRAIINSLPL